MNKKISFMFGVLLVLFVWESAHPQNDTTRKDYKVIKSELITKSGQKGNIVEYDFKGSHVKAREMYFRDRNEQDEELAAVTKNYIGCGTQIGIFNNTGVEIGRKITCEDKASKTFIIAYSHFDVLNKVNVISGESRLTVEEFVKGICPYAYHLYPEIECPGFDSIVFGGLTGEPSSAIFTPQTKFSAKFYKIGSGDYLLLIPLTEP